MLCIMNFALHINFVNQNKITPDKMIDLTFKVNTVAHFWVTDTCILLQFKHV